MKQMKINVPEGHEIDTERSDLSTGEIYFREKLREKELPKRWEDLEKVSGYYTGAYSQIEWIGEIGTEEDTRKTWPTREEAEASIALAQLCQLRDAYNGCKFSEFHEDDLFFAFVPGCFETSILGFKTSDLRDKFNSEPEIQKLIEIAKPLL